MRYSIIILISFLSACAPYPHKVVATSHIYGRIFTDTKVKTISYFPEKAECSEITNKSNVDADGYFELPYKEKWQFFIALFMADCGSYMTVCAETEDKKVFKWQDQYFHGCNSIPDEIMMRCFLENGALSCGGA